LNQFRIRIKSQVTDKDGHGKTDSGQQTHADQFTHVHSLGKFGDAQRNTDGGETSDPDGFAEQQTETNTQTV
jgi:hypothetical protein